MRARIFLGCVSVGLIFSGCSQHRVATAPPPAIPSAATAPVVVAGAVREAPPNDYLRVLFVKPGTPVTTLSIPTAKRAFATATILYVPPLTLEEYPKYSGLVNNDSNTLIAMRCKPPDTTRVDAVLATWPNVFAAIERDVKLEPGDCDAAPADPEKQVACYAKGFTDPPQAAVPASLSRTFNYAGTIYDGNHAAMAGWLQKYYGIYPAFAGSGYSVKDSYYLDRHPMTSQQILERSISPEYLLKNVSLKDAGCRCISVPAYEGRSKDPLDPDFVEHAGGDGECNEVKRLR